MRAMTDTESQLLAALDELAITAKQPTGAGTRPSLLPLFSRIDTLAAQLPPGGDPELRHLLQRKSYEPARKRLQGFTGGRCTCRR